ncbi:unnamed protein product [Schistocephalus solidus]|uniref:C2H2-type domain-containing protein n=1 Tax=Schistocephalus solidus TaxID=70667 RepID=A0A183SIE4_SCHSO|nr:unnamed protein product [Schistocephalus solidus]
MRQIYARTRLLEADSLSSFQALRQSQPSCDSFRQHNDMSTEGAFCGRQAVVCASNIHDPRHHQQATTTADNPLRTSFSCIMPPRFSAITQPQVAQSEGKENRAPTTLKSFYNFPPPPESTMNQQGLPLGFLESSTTFSLIGTPPLYIGPSGMPFRYHLRRPVESWKYTENKNEDGSLVYMCRFCSAVYKHKKSLNKHWKDKHFGEIGPNGEAGNEDEEEEDEEEEEAVAAAADVENSPPPEHSFEASEPQRSCLASTPVASKTFNVKLSTVSPITSSSVTIAVNAPVVQAPSSQRMQRLSLPFARPTRSPHMRASLRRLPPAPSVKRPIMPCSPPNAIATTTSSSTVSSSSTRREEEVASGPGNFLPISSKRRNSEMPPLSPRAVHCIEYSPLDLSLSKADTQTALEEPIVTPTQSGPLKDRHLLSLLLQTALGALAGEPESVKTIDDLSANTLSLLRSVGGILVSSTLEEKPKMGREDPREEATKNQPPVDRRTEPLVMAEVPPPPLNSPPTPVTAQNFGIKPQGLSLSAYAQQSLPVSRESNERINTVITHPPFRLVELLPPLLPDEQQQPHPQEHRHQHHHQQIQQQQTGDTVIPCPVCTFVGRWFSELRAHMVNHSEHRMFGCCYCSYRAKWKWDVAKHMRRCPLSRHVAHLQNEYLLRMVCYFPPPQGDILFAYFPQYGFPGVGIDKPISPPPPPPSTGSTTAEPTDSVPADMQTSTTEAVVLLRETRLLPDQNLSLLPHSDASASEVKSKCSAPPGDDANNDDDEDEKPLCIDELEAPVDEVAQDPDLAANTVSVSDAAKIDSQSQYSTIPPPTTNQLNAKLGSEHCLSRYLICHATGDVLR